MKVLIPAGLVLAGFGLLYAFAWLMHYRLDAWWVWPTGVLIFLGMCTSWATAIILVVYGEEAGQ